jgi:CHAD domain-containing protein
MGLNLDIDAPLADSLKQAGARWLDKGAMQLQHGRDGGRVHEARKAFKRFRSLLRLMRAGLADEDFVALDRCIRDIARSLSGARDAQAMIEAAEGLRAGLDVPAAALDRLKLLLEAHRQKLPPDAAPGRACVKSLRRLKRSFAAAPLSADGFDIVATGFAGVYMAGRKGMRRAATGGAEERHDWRKDVQRHWRHLQFLEGVWPKAMRPQAILARDLSATLGNDHDLTILREFIHRNRDALDGWGPALQRACRLRQKRLADRAFIQGARLYAEKPKALARRIGAYWRTAVFMDELEKREQHATREGAPSVQLRLVKQEP